MIDPRYGVLGRQLGATLFNHYPDGLPADAAILGELIKLIDDRFRGCAVADQEIRDTVFGEALRRYVELRRGPPTAFMLWLRRLRSRFQPRGRLYEQSWTPL